MMWRGFSGDITMSAKEQKTRQDLTTMIMQRIRQYPDWSDIVDVAITRPETPAYQPNWDATFTMHGQLTPPDAAFQIIRDLRNKYDLVEN
jgi:hypothetical protein